MAPAAEHLLAGEVLGGAFIIAAHSRQGERRRRADM